jgi:hypothetical protein
MPKVRGSNKSAWISSEESSQLRVSCASAVATKFFRIDPYIYIPEYEFFRSHANLLHGMVENLHKRCPMCGTFYTNYKFPIYLTSRGEELARCMCMVAMQPAHMHAFIKFSAALLQGENRGLILPAAVSFSLNT